jgi:hypothetical protein
MMLEDAEGAEECAFGLVWAHGFAAPGLPDGEVAHAAIVAEDVPCAGAAEAVDTAEGVEGGGDHASGGIGAEMGIVSSAGDGCVEGWGAEGIEACDAEHFVEMFAGGTFVACDIAGALELFEQGFGSPGEADTSGGVGDLDAVAGDAVVLAALW